MESFNHGSVLHFNLGHNERNIKWKFSFSNRNNRGRLGAEADVWDLALFIGQSIMHAGHKRVDM